MNGPYAQAALDYLDAGWAPIPVRGKTLLVTGFTGAHDNWPDREQVERWIEEFGDANVALRLPKHIIGIDVDAYDDKPGAATLAAAESELGKLPPTWVSTSRPTGSGSGIRLYRVPAGLAWPESLTKLYGGAVDLIRWDHRYVVVSPSLHPSGTEYRWISPTGAEDEYPEVGEI